MLATAANYALKDGVHDRLLQDIDAIASMSRVPVTMIKQSSADHLTPSMLSWLISFRQLKANGKANAFLEGHQHKSPERVFMAAAAVLIRNFIDARVFSLQHLLDSPIEELIQPTVMLVPNFQNNFVGKPLASHQVQKLYSVILDRMGEDKVTVVYLENFDVMVEQYGVSIAECVGKNFAKIKG